MNKLKFKDIILESCNDIIFNYKNKPSGITVIVTDYKPTYQVWHGDRTKEYDNINDLMTDKFYSGKSLDELVETIDLEVV